MTVWELVSVDDSETTFGLRSEKLVANSFAEVLDYVVSNSGAGKSLNGREVVRIERLGTIDRIITRKK
jgi:hypothetical protein